MIPCHMLLPEIVKSEGEEIGTEACLSIPGYFGENIRRFAKIVVKGQDVRGKAIRVPAEGWFARILQHEMDHLNGVLFIDHLSRLKRDMVLKKLAKWRKEQGLKAA